MRFHPWRLALVLSGAAWLLAAAPLRAEVVISEFLADNDHTLLDEDGDKSDWVELYNNGATAVNLQGWRLTDAAGNPGKWVLPAVNLAADARLVIFASGKNRQAPGQTLHTNFALKKSGGYLALSRPDGTVTTVFSAYPEQRTDISYGGGAQEDRQTLIDGSSTGKYFVPVNGELGLTWTAPGFNDGGWPAGTSRPGYQAAGAQPGQLLANWTVDTTLENAVSGGASMVVSGAEYHEAVPEPIGTGGSLHFTRAAGNYASAVVDVSETAYTASFWFRTGNANTGMFMVGAGTLGSGGYDRQIYLDEGNIAAQLYNGALAGMDTISSTGLNLADGQWHHVAHVFGGPAGAAITQRLYVDGVLRAFKPTGGTAKSDFTAQTNIEVGFAKAPAGSNYFDGEIDDVAIWNEALDQAAIAKLAAGESPTALAGFLPFIGTNVEAAMRNVGPSLYLRLPFTVNRLTPFNTATLKVRYGDGFIAYLDGQEVARRNAPSGASYLVGANLSRPAEEALEEETIDLTGWGSLLGNGPHVLAIHALNDSAASPDFLFNGTLSAATITAAAGIYLDPPTPGAANGTGFAGFVQAPTLSIGRGHYTTPQTVTMASATPGATLVYTANGSEPSETNGTVVPPPNPSTGPSVTVQVAGTRSLRALAYKAGSGLRPTAIETHSYLFLGNMLTQPTVPAGYPANWSTVVADYAMDPNVVNTTLPGYSVLDGLRSLPSLSLAFAQDDFFGSPNGLIYDPMLRGPGAEKKVSVEWLNQDNSPGWQVNCGIHAHGASSRDLKFSRKTPMRLVFRSEYGESKLRQDVFGGGVTKFDQLVLRPCSTDSMPVIDGYVADGEKRWDNTKPTYMRDQYIRDVLNDLGSPNARGCYVHLYLNGLYWGLYNVTERPNADFFADTVGGEKEEWDVVKDFAELDSGNLDAWNAMMAIVADPALTDAVRCQKLLGNNLDGTRNPAYPIYVNWPIFRDYMIVHIAAGAEDWPQHNFWAGRRRGPASDGFRFVAWDQEIANDSLTRTSGGGSDNTFQEVDEGGPGMLYNRFRRVASFQQDFRDRIHTFLFNNGPLTPAAQRARWMVRQAQIDKAIVAESARWGDSSTNGLKKRETNWLGVMNFMNTPGTGYWDKIQPIDVQRFQSVQLYPSILQPTFSQAGGSVPAGYALQLAHPTSTIYYTLDGSDPRGANGAPSPTALLYNLDQTPVSAGARWKYLVTATPATAAWKTVAFNDAAWPEGPAQLGYGDGDEQTVIGYGPNPASRYPTTYFRKAFSLSNVAGISTATVRILRDDGAVIYLNGTEIVRSNMHPTNNISYATSALTNVTGADESTTFYDYPVNVSLLQEGTNVLAVEIHKSSVSDDDLSFDCELKVVRPTSIAGVILNAPAIVRARARTSSGEWSGLNEAYFSVGTQLPSSGNLGISELMYHPSAPTAEELAVTSDAEDFEYIELRNFGAQMLDLSGCRFTAGVDFTFPVNTTLAPGGYLLVVRNLDAFRKRYGPSAKVAGTYGPADSLNNAGETITLEDASHHVIQSFTYGDSAPWPALADGAGYSLVSIAPQVALDRSLASNWRASMTAGGNPNGSDALVFTGAANADADGDGSNAFLEFALGTSDQVPNAQATSLLLDPAGLRFTYQHPINADDVSYQIEVAQTLPNWGPAQAVRVSATVNGNIVTESWLIAGVAGAKFARLKVTSR